MVEARRTKLEQLLLERGAPEPSLAAAREWLDGARPELVAHGVATAELLLDLQLDAAALLAALLAPVVHTDSVDREEVRERLGAEVAGLIDGIERLASIRWDRLEDEAAEKLRKMFLAMASDVRVVLIVLAARVHDMRTLATRTPEDRHRIAAETMEVFAPLANRLGIWHVKWELEDQAFRELQPDTYREIRDLIAEKRGRRTEYVEELVGQLQREVAAVGIEAKIYGRPKHIYSIYRKMKRKGVSFDQIYDALAVRVIVDEVAQCYAILGIVHGLWEPIPGEFDDYIARPKENFYRSLHTAVIGPEERSVEIQLRTREMHEFAEYGVAAHWRYKEGGSAGRAQSFEAKVNWLRQLMEWQKDVQDPHEFVESLKTDVFQDQVYVFTPTGDVLDLPVGSTPLDFAYRIHTQVGHRCRGAKVGGNIVPLDYELKTGDRVEIITTKSGTPSRDWLNPHLGYVRTASARQKIRQHFRAQERDTAVATGRELVEKELKRLCVDDVRPDDVAALLGYERPDELYAALGFGDITTQRIASRLMETEDHVPEALPPPRSPQRKKSASGVSLAGVDDVMSRAASCCNPVPGDAVVGYVTRGRGMSLHRRDCPNMRNPPEPERVMEVEWAPRMGERYPISVRIVANDRAGLLRDVTEVIATEGINVRAASTYTDADGTAYIDTTLEVRTSDQAVRVMAKLERLPYVRRAIRVRGA